MKQYRLPILLLLAIYFITTSCIKKDVTVLENKTAIQHSIDKQAHQFLEDSLITSVSIGIIKDGKKITAHYGELDSGKKNTPTDATYYEIASVSKTFAGALVAQAELEGKLSLQDDIRKYLTEAYPNFEFEGEPIRIIHLLTHQAGLPQFLPTAIGEAMNQINEELPFKVHEIEKAYSKDRFLTDLKTIELTAIPGSQYHYSNVDVELMAYILETIYDMPYEDIVLKKITAIARMPHTKIHLSTSEKQNLANGYGINRRLVPHFSNTLWGADGGIKSTVPDMVNYMELLLQSENKMISKSQEILIDLGDYGSGYFWPIRLNTPHGTYYNHHGGAYGTQNWLYIYPKYDLGIYVVTNQSDLETAGKLQQLVDAILEEVIVG